EEARRGPDEVLADHAAFGTGGTCFSLTATMLHLVRALGFEAEPILADRRYGADTHCAMLVWLDAVPHLLDPGYLIVRPLAIPKSGEVRLTMPAIDVVLAAKDGGERIDLLTGIVAGVGTPTPAPNRESGVGVPTPATASLGFKYRLTYKTTP